METNQKEPNRNVLPEDPLEGMGDLSAIDPVAAQPNEEPAAELMPALDDMGLEEVAAVSSTDSLEALDTLVNSGEGDHNPVASSDEKMPSLDQLIDAIDEEIEMSLEMVEGREMEQASEPIVEEAQFVTFSLAGTEYAVAIHNVAEIAYLPEITSLPNVPEWILGVANLRGDLISIIDLRSFFGLDWQTPTASTRLLVGKTTPEDVTVGLLVDQAHGIRYLAVDQIEKPTADIDSKIASYLYGAYDEGQHLIVLLDMDRVLNSPKLRQFEQQAV
jgi:purine-binding chemotaxis protein CheW